MGTLSYFNLPKSTLLSLFFVLITLKPIISTSLRSSQTACSLYAECLPCLENPNCGFCYSSANAKGGIKKVGRCMLVHSSGAPLQPCRSGWIVAPLTDSKIAKNDEAHTCLALKSQAKHTGSNVAIREELFVEGELLGLVSRACVPCRGFWPHCDCKNIVRKNTAPIPSVSTKNRTVKSIDHNIDHTSLT